MRSSLERKYNIFFDAEYKKQFIDIEIKQTIEMDDTNLDEKMNKINNEFALAATLFIANQSENQSNFIRQTNIKEINDAVVQEEVLFVSRIAQEEAEVTRLRGDLVFANEAQRSRLNRRIRQRESQIRETTENSQEVIAENIGRNLINKSQARSDLIASQNVGLAESWARQTEASLTEAAALATAAGALVRINKTWIAILDNKTRAAHSSADSQEVSVNESFVVGGESLLMPRDPNGSPGNIINCRCISQNSVDTI